MIRQSRQEKASSLVSVIVIGVLSIVFLLVLSSMLLDAARAIASSQWTDALRNASEIGIDYAVDKFNSTYPCSLDPASGSMTSILPSTELESAAAGGAAPTPGIPNITVTITVKRLDASDWAFLKTNSSIYSAQLDPTGSTSSIVNGIAVPTSTNMTATSGGGFRVVESKASNGLFSKTIRVILKSRFDDPPDGQFPLQGGGASPSTKNYFQQPIFGNTSVSFFNGSQVGNPLSPGTHLSSDGTYNIYDSNVSTNGKATIGHGSVISGDVVVNGADPNGLPVVVSDSGSGGDGLIQGRLVTNGTVDAVAFDASAANANANIQARADQPTGSYNPGARAGENSSNPLVEAAGQSQYQLAPAPESSSVFLMSDLSSYASAGTTPTSITTSDTSIDLHTSSLSTKTAVDNFPANKTVTLENGSKPVRIFVDQGSNSDSAVNLDASRLLTTSNDPSNLQIWYEGNRPVKLNLDANFNGLIYAPNAPITLSGTGTLTGALVGNKIDMQSGTLMPAANLSQTYKFRPGQGSLIQGWQPITWQEIN